MSTKWQFTLVKEVDPNLYGVFLAIKSKENNPQVTRYLVGKFDDQLLPFGIDRFATLVEAHLRCTKDFNLKEGDWQEIEEPPAFHAIVETSTDLAIDAVMKDMISGEGNALQGST